MSNIFGLNAVIEQIKKNKNQVIVVHVYKDNKNFINFLKTNNVKLKIHHDKS